MLVELVLYISFSNILTIFLEDSHSTLSRTRQSLISDGCGAVRAAWRCGCGAVQVDAGHVPLCAARHMRPRIPIVVLVPDVAGRTFVAADDPAPHGIPVLVRVLRHSHTTPPQQSVPSPRKRLAFPHPRTMPTSPRCPRAPKMITIHKGKRRMFIR